MPISTINTNSIADDAVTVPKVTDQVLTHRNLIINGAMQVAQRGTNITTSTGYTYGIDRWSDYWGMNYLQQTATINGATANTCKFTTQSSNFYLYYRIEDNITKNEVAASYYAGKTLSFWYRSNFAATSIGLFDITTVGDETWRYYTKTFTSTPSKSSEFLEFVGRASGTDYIEMTQVQLEVGDTATPFEHLTYAEDLVNCQRYLYSATNSDTGYIASFWQYDGNSNLNAFLKFPTTMRAEPTLVHNASNSGYFVGYGAGQGLSWTTLTLNSQTLDSAMIFNNQFNAYGSGTAGGLYVGSSAAYLWMDAEI